MKLRRPRIPLDADDRRTLATLGIQATAITVGVVGGAGVVGLAVRVFWRATGF